jgi:hypothetical protein
MKTKQLTTNQDWLKNNINIIFLLTTLFLPTISEANPISYTEIGSDGKGNSFQVTFMYENNIIASSVSATTTDIYGTTTNINTLSATGSNGVLNGLAYQFAVEPAYNVFIDLFFEVNQNTPTLTTYTGQVTYTDSSPYDTNFHINPVPIVAMIIDDSNPLTPNYEVGFTSSQVTLTKNTTVPEPSSIALLVSGFIGFFVSRRNMFKPVNRLDISARSV